MTKTIFTSPDEKPSKLELNSPDQESPKFNFAPSPDQYRRILKELYDHTSPCGILEFEPRRISPAYWQDAMIYLRLENNRIGAITTSQVRRGQKALCHYQSLYLYRTLDHDAIKDLLHKSPRDLFDAIQDQLGSDLRQKFLAQDAPRVISPDTLQNIPFASLYDYPEWLEFTPEANAGIISRILNNQLTDEEIDFYLGTGERAEEYANLYPALKHVFRSTNNYHLFYIAGDILNLIWINLPDDDDLERWFQSEIHDLFWTRIGGLWPITHYQEIRFQNSDQQGIFEDALGWILSLDDETLQERNPALWDFIQNLTSTDFNKVLHEQHKRVARKVFNLTHANSKVPELISDVAKYYNDEEGDHILYHSGNPDIARRLITYSLDQIKHPERRQAGLDCLENLFTCSHFDTAEVRQTVLKLMPKCAFAISKAVEHPDLITLFATACDCVRTAHDLPLLEDLADVLNELNPKLAEKINSLRQNTQRSVADYETQAEDLRKNLAKYIKKSSSKSKSKPPKKS